MQDRRLSEGNEKTSKTSNQVSRDFWLKFEIEDTGIGISSNPILFFYELV